jgi:hypothetical protein
MQPVDSYQLETRDARFTLDISKSSDGRYIGKCLGTTPKYTPPATGGGDEPTIRQLPLDAFAGATVDEVIKKCRQAIEERYGPVVA